MEKHGYPFESHRVLTGDGYLVTLHRIPAIGGNAIRTNPAVLFVPPMLCSSIDWVSRGPNESLGLILSGLGNYSKQLQYFLEKNITLC